MDILISDWPHPAFRTVYSRSNSKTCCNSKIENSNANDIWTQRTPTLDEYDEFKAEWREKYKVAKLIGMYSAARLYIVWKFDGSKSTLKKILFGQDL